MRHVHGGAIAIATLLLIATPPLWAQPVSILHDTQLDWTTVPVGATTYVATFIDNDGDRDLNLSDAGITGNDKADFKLIELPGSVKPRDIDYPGSGKRILVSFTPSFPGYKTAMLSFKTDELGSSSYSITLPGIGIAPPTPQEMAVSTWGYRYKTRPSLSAGDLVTQMHEAPGGGVFLVGIEDQYSDTRFEEYTYRRAVVGRVGPEGSTLWLKQ